MSFNSVKCILSNGFTTNNLFNKLDSSVDIFGVDNFITLLCL